MKTSYNLYEYETSLKKQGFNFIAGCDEAGRGPIFGPVVAACCVLPDNFKLDGLTDSKQLTEKKREQYFEYLKERVIYGIGIVDNKEIDEINIYEASRKAMMLALAEVRRQTKVDYVLTDAMPLPDLDIPYMDIIKGDAKSISIAAASVIAKVTRDHMMMEIDKTYPEYDFASHKGYPTKKHIEAINEFGLIDGYRLTYAPIKNMVKKD